MNDDLTVAVYMLLTTGSIQSWGRCGEHVAIGGGTS